jgi:hypothetical protein
MSDESSESGVGRKVFLSYSRSDRVRVDGLALLLTALGHEVVLDRLSIIPGQRWQERLETFLQEADVLIVFWTKAADRSTWVRREYEFFNSRFPSRPLVPVIGDETPLSGLLSDRQNLDFAPIVNELLQLQRSMSEEGASRSDIERAIVRRLESAGVTLPDRDRRAMLRMFGLGGLVGAILSPVATLRWTKDRLADGFAQLSGAQTAIVILAASSGVVLSGPVMDAIVPTRDIVGSSQRAQLERAAPFEIRSAEQSRFLKLESWESGELIATYLVPAGAFMQTALPLGTYRIKVAFGSSWVDERMLFGPDTRYESLPDSFVVSQGHAYWIEWRSGGNAKQISPEEW